MSKQRSSWRKIGLSIMGFIGRATGAAGTLSGGNSSAATPKQSSSRSQVYPLIVTNTHLYVWCGWMGAVTDFDKYITRMMQFSVLLPGSFGSDLAPKAARIFRDERPMVLQTLESIVHHWNDREREELSDDAPLDLGKEEPRGRILRLCDQIRRSLKGMIEAGVHREFIQNLLDDTTVELTPAQREFFADLMPGTGDEDSPCGGEGVMQDGEEDAWMYADVDVNMVGQEEVTNDSKQQEARKDPVDYESRPMYVAGTDENHKLVKQDLYKPTDSMPPVIAFPQEYCGGHCELPLITLPDTPGRIFEYRIRVNLLLVAKDMEKAGNLSQLDA